MLNTKFDLYKREWLDLVFADRNKAYGAYDLRNHYGDNMLKAMAITVAGFTFAAITLTLIVQRKPAIESPPVVSYHKDIPIAPVVEAVKKTEKPKARLASQTKPIPASTSNVPSTRFVEPRPTNEPVTEEPPVISQLIGAIGPIDNKGDSKSEDRNIMSGTPGPGIEQGPPAEDVSIHNTGGLDAMPEPVGGNSAWSKFLQKNINYPDVDAEGRVIISFVIEKDGHLTNITVLKGVLSELDQEALRVLKLAPAWKPGTQNGQPVRVRFTVPIVFQRMQ